MNAQPSSTIEHAADEPAVTSRPRGVVQRVRRVQRSDLTLALNKWGVLIAFIALVVAASLLHERFLTVPNLLNVARQIAIVGVLAVGMTYVILVAGIDLSVGSTLALAAVISADTAVSHGAFAGVVAALVVGAAVGLVNGLGVTVGGVQPFIMTLGMLAAARGLAFMYTDGHPIASTDPAYLEIGSGRTAGIPNPAIILIVLAFLSYIVLRHTVFGRYVYAVGSSEDAARRAGIPTNVIKLCAFVICGFMAGVAGLLYASQLGVGSPVAGEGFELDAIAAVVVGGASLYGGVGTIQGTVLGAGILGVLGNLLNLTGVSPFVQRVFRGALIVVAVMVQRKGGRIK